MASPAISNELTDILPASTEQAAKTTPSISEEPSQLFGLAEDSPEFPATEQDAKTAPSISEERNQLFGLAEDSPEFPATEQAAKTTPIISEELNQLFGLADDSPEFPVLPPPPSSQAAASNMLDAMPTGYSQWKPIDPSPVQQSMHLLNSGEHISNGYNPQHSLADFTNVSQHQNDWNYPNLNVPAGQINPDLNYPQSHTQLYPQYPTSYNDPGPWYVPSYTYPDPQNLPSYNYPDQVRRQHGYQSGPPRTFDPRASYGFDVPSGNQPQIIHPSPLPRSSSHHPKPPKNIPRPYPQATRPAINSAVKHRPQSKNPIPPQNRPRPRHRKIPRGTDPSSQFRSPSRQPNHPQNPPSSPQGASQESNVASDDVRSTSYTPLKSPPEPWGPFTYNSYGELAPKKLFSVEEIFQYLYSNPSHNTPEGYTPLSGGLTLWLQRSPVRAIRRCGDPLAARCRFKNCPTKGNVIAKGEMRVAFDEYTKRIPTHNPQHMAGFVHLRCLELFTLFPNICKDFNVLAEGRILPSEPRGRNTMILRGPAELLHAERFIDFCRREGRPPRTYSALGADARTSNQRTLQEELDGFTDGAMNATLKRRWEESGREGVNRGKRLIQERKARTYVEQKRRVQEDRSEDELETRRRPKKKQRRW